MLSKSFGVEGRLWLGRVMDSLSKVVRFLILVGVFFLYMFLRVWRTFLGGEGLRGVLFTFFVVVF